MQKFPKVNKDQIVLIRADSKTGHILDDKFELAIDDTQCVYAIFDSISEAKKYIKSAITNNQHIEFVLYNSDEVLIDFIS